jgi:hypothetical protein
MTLFQIFTVTLIAKTPMLTVTLSPIRPRRPYPEYTLTGMDSVRSEEVRKRKSAREKRLSLKTER